MSKRFKLWQTPSRYYMSWTRLGWRVDVDDNSTGTLFLSSKLLVRAALIIQSNH